MEKERRLNPVDMPKSRDLRKGKDESRKAIQVVTQDGEPLQEAYRDQGAALIRLRRGLGKHFGVEAGIFVDPLLWMLGCVCVDIVRLDYWLQKRNPDYGSNESMCFFIRRKYGRDAEHFVAYWLKGERTGSR
jgi:hypothetical protein